METAEILDAMAERLRTKGWIQKIAWKHKIIPTPQAPMGVLSPGEACLQGTCEQVTNINMTSFSVPEIAVALTNSITALFPDRIPGGPGETPWYPVIYFNDHESTTFEDVMLVVKHARESVE